MIVHGQGDRDQSSGLHAYIQQMMAVMAFDAGRQGRLISQMELDIYTLRLAIGQTRTRREHVEQAWAELQRVAGELAGENVEQMPELYLQIVMTSVGSGIVLLLCTPLLRKLMGDVH